MRNKLIIIVAIFAFATGANAQNADKAKNVIRQCREKCHSIRGGHYEVEFSDKGMDFKDTTTIRLICDYKKQPKIRCLENFLPPPRKVTVGAVPLSIRAKSTLSATITKQQSCRVIAGSTR